MVDLVFGVLAVAYLWFGSKVEAWVTLTELGFRTKTPASFADHPGAYDAIRIALFLGAALCLVATTLVPWYVGALILVGAWMATTAFGFREAFATSRAAWLESREPAVTQPGISEFELQEKLLG